MCNDLLTKLEAELEARKNDAKARYHALVVAVADDNPPTAAKAESVLTAAGKTLDDLRADTERLQQRRGWLATVATAPALSAEQIEIETALGAENDRWQVIEKAHDDIVEPLVARLEQIREQRMAIAAARADLTRSMSPAIRDEIAVIERRQTQIYAELADARNGLQKVEVEISSFDRRKANDLPSLMREPDAAILRERELEFRALAASQTKKFSEQIAELEAELAASIARIAELTTQGLEVS
jgi:hypothetical protein